MGNNLMSVEDAANYLGVKPSWIYNNHRTQKMPARKIGGHLRFRVSELDRWIDKQGS